MRQHLEVLQSLYTTPALLQVWQQLQSADDSQDLAVLERVLAQMHSLHNTADTSAAGLLKELLQGSR